MSKLKPMLAVAMENLESLQYPLLASYKLDGVRCLITEDGPRTRSLKRVTNPHVESFLARLPVGLDGEMVVLDPDGSVNFRKTTGDLLRQTGTPSFEYRVFDWFNQPGTFEERLQALGNLRDTLPLWAVVVDQWRVERPDDALALFEKAIKFKYEGLILRDPKGAYKFGRSTLREQGMIKMKPWKDAEAVVIGVVQAMFNANEAKTNELGRTYRSSAKAGKIPKAQIGTLVVQSPLWPKPFEIGTGFGEENSIEWFMNPPIGKIVRFSYVDAGGYDLPRHASFQGFRDPTDMD